ncbi:MAG: VCBS repeat-containing protein, partial [Bacteroidetes bacterium]|nr:VCBS repeat-containing protein [Bacteroidota bacterium]
DDLVAMNRGWNSPAGRNGSLRIYHGRFAADGVYRAIEAQPRDDLGDWGPIHPFNDVLSEWPEIWRYISHYSDWSMRTMNSLPGISGVRIAEASYLTHTLFLNKPGRFVPVPLPDIAQRAPSHGVAVLDANLDGFPDLVIAQNDFAVLPEGAARYDAGRGLLLLGDGSGGFEAVSGTLSNIHVYGDQRGVVTGDFDGNGLPDVAITQNGASTVVHLHATEPVDCQTEQPTCDP